MTTEEKLQLIVDRLLVKTQDGLCEWKKNTDNKYCLRTSAATIYLYNDVIIGGEDSIKLDVNGNHNLELTISSVSINSYQTNSTLVRLYNAVKIFHQTYVDEQLGKLMTELDKLSNEKPF